MSLETEKFNIFEWFFETLNKRLGPPYNIPLNELFLCVPYEDEAAFDFELESAFNNGVKSGNILASDYPNLNRELTRNSKIKRIKVFFVHPSKCPKSLVLWTKKFKYPKISQSKPIPRILAETAVRQIERKRNLILN